MSLHGYIRDPHFRSFILSPTALSGTTMASYYPPSPSSPFAGANFSPRPQYYQRPPSTLLEQVDVYATVPSPLAPTPSAPLKSAGLPPCANQVLKSPKTFLQWKANAKATTDDYQRNGFPSPVAWVITSSITPYSSSSFGSWACYPGLRRMPRNPPQCCHWRCGPQRAMVCRPIIL
jgi:hypothetical protein